MALHSRSRFSGYTGKNCRSARLSRKAVVLLLALFLTIAVGTSHAGAGITNTRSDAWGTLELSGGSWLGGAGVDVFSNGAQAIYSPDKPNNYVSVGGASILSGEKWQCVELVNRLYLARGWISSTWRGNGAQLYANAPAGLVKQANGSISYIAAGDVISLTDGGAGHAAVVNTVTANGDGSKTVQIVNQNTTAVYSSATLRSGTLTMSGWNQYTFVGVIHAPANGGGDTIPRIVIRQGSSVAAKDGLTDPWVNSGGWRGSDPGRG